MGQGTWEVPSRGNGIFAGIGQTKLGHFPVMPGLYVIHQDGQSILLALIVSIQKLRCHISDFMIAP